MAVDWTKPIEAVNKDTGAIVPMTFEKFDPIDGEPLTRPNPRDPNDADNSCWRMDGSNWFGHDEWKIRNVQPQGRTFLIDHRDNAGLHELYVNTALDILEVVSDSLARLDDFSNINAMPFTIALRKERARLVKEDAAFFEAAAISCAGKDWIDAVE